MQPYIFKKQIIQLCVFVLALLPTKQLSSSLFYALLFYTFIIISTTFVPLLRRRVKYPATLHSLLFTLPYYLPLFFFRFEQKNGSISHSLVFGLIIGMVTYLSKVKELRYTYSPSNLSKLSPMSRGTFTVRLAANVTQIVGEEMFFRYFLVNILWDDYKYMAIVISSLLFINIHFLNRWADKMFTRISYLYHGILGLCLSFVFIRTRSVLGCILAHFIFNFSEFFTLFKRVFVKEKEESFFSDY